MSNKSKFFYFSLKCIFCVLTLASILQIACTNSHDYNESDDNKTANNFSDVVVFVKVTMKEDGAGEKMIFEVRNPLKSSFECDAVMHKVLYNSSPQEEIFPLGILNGFSERKYEFPVQFEEGLSNYNVSLDCKEYQNKSPELVNLNFTSIQQAVQQKNCSALEQDQWLCEMVLKNNLRECLSQSPDDANFCLAFLTQNSSFCDLGNPIIQYKCKAFVMNNYHFCSLYEETNLRELCYMDFALNNNLFFICDYIKNPEKQAACFAVQGKDFDKCIAVNDSAAKKLCISALMTVLRNDSLCNQLSEELKEFCLNSVHSV